MLPVGVCAQVIEPLHSYVCFGLDALYLGPLRLSKRGQLDVFRSIN
jgi:hypothetical protein